MIKFIGLRSSHVNRTKDENDTSKAIAKETKKPVEEREGVIEFAKNARKSSFSMYSYKAIKSDDIKPSLNKLKVTEEEYKKFFSCFYDVKVEKNGIITYRYTDTMQQTSEFYFKIAKEFAGKIGDEPKCDGKKDNWAGINTIAYRLALSLAEMKSCQEGKCEMEDIIRSRINNPPPEVTNNKEYIKEQEKKLNIAKKNYQDFHLFKSSNIKLPELEDGKKYTVEQLIGIRKDIDKLKSASHGAFETLSQEYKPSPSLINNTNFSNIIIQSKSETRELEIDQEFANKIFRFLDSLKDEFESNKDNGILTFKLNHDLKLNSSDLFEIAKYFAAKVGGEPENNKNGVGINTYLSRVATHLFEKKLVTENKADQVDIYEARIEQPPFELTEDQKREYKKQVYNELKNYQDFKIYNSSTIKLPILDDNKKYTPEQLYKIWKDIDELKKQPHKAYDTSSRMGLANNQEEIGKPENFKHSISQRIVCYADYLSQEIKDDEGEKKLYDRFLIAILCLQDDYDFIPDTEEDDLYATEEDDESSHKNVYLPFPDDDLHRKNANCLLRNIPMHHQKIISEIILKKLKHIPNGLDTRLKSINHANEEAIYNTLFKNFQIVEELKKFKGTDIENFKKALTKFTYETANEDTAKDVHISKTSYEHLAEDEKETSLQKIIFGNLILNLFNFNSKPKKNHMKIHIFPDNIENKEPKCVTMDENKIPLKDDNQFCLKELSEFFSSLYDCINFTQTKPNSPPEPSPQCTQNKARATSSTNTNGENLKII